MIQARIVDQVTAIMGAGALRGMNDRHLTVPRPREALADRTETFAEHEQDVAGSCGRPAELTGGPVRPFVYPGVNGAIRCGWRSGRRDELSPCWRLVFQPSLHPVMFARSSRFCSETKQRIALVVRTIFRSSTRTRRRDESFAEVQNSVTLAGHVASGRERDMACAVRTMEPRSRGKGDWVRRPRMRKTAGVAVACTVAAVGAACSGKGTSTSAGAGRDGASSASPVVGASVSASDEAIWVAGGLTDDGDGRWAVTVADAFDVTGTPLGTVELDVPDGQFLFTTEVLTVDDRDYLIANTCEIPLQDAGCVSAATPVLYDLTADTQTASEFLDVPATSREPGAGIVEALGADDSRVLVAQAAAPGTYPGQATVEMFAVEAATGDVTPVELPDGVPNVHAICMDGQRLLAATVTVTDGAAAGVTVHEAAASDGPWSEIAAFDPTATTAAAVSLYCDGGRATVHVASSPEELIDVASGKMASLEEGQWISSAAYGPDGLVAAVNTSSQHQRDVTHALFTAGVLGTSAGPDAAKDRPVDDLPVVVAFSGSVYDVSSVRAEGAIRRPDRPGKVAR